MIKTPELFNQWNEEKKGIESKHRKIIVKEGEIRNCKIGLNIGSELSKDGFFSRPILVLKTGIGGDLVLAAPLTTKYKQEFHKHYIELDNYKEYGLQFKSRIITHQIRPLSIKRLIRKLNNIIIDKRSVPIIHSHVIHSILSTYQNLILD